MSMIMEVAIFPGKAIRTEKPPELKEALEDLEGFYIGIIDGGTGSSAQL